MVWDYESLWNKALAYVGRGQSEDRESGAFSLWYLMAFELLARAALARIHPALLADPIDGGDNLLYAFGYGAAKNPKSVTAATVFKRCEKIMPEMTDEDVKSSLGLIAYRNEELHSGSAVLEGLSTETWLAEYYRLCGILLESQGKTLKDLFGSEEAVAAQKMVAAVKQNLITQANVLVAAARKNYEQLADEDKIARIEAAKTPPDKGRAYVRQLVSCPACGNLALIQGELIRVSAPRIAEGEIAYDNIVLPTRLQCAVCELVLPDHAHLHAIEMGGQFTTTGYADPMEFYYGGQPPGSDDYGND